MPMAGQLCRWLWGGGEVKGLSRNHKLGGRQQVRVAVGGRGQTRAAPAAPAPAPAPPGGVLAHSQRATNPAKMAPRGQDTGWWPAGESCGSNQWRPGAGGQEQEEQEKQEARSRRNRRSRRPGSGHRPEAGEAMGWEEARHPILGPGHPRRVVAGPVSMGGQGRCVVPSWCVWCRHGRRCGWLDGSLGSWVRWLGVVGL